MKTPNTHQPNNNQTRPQTTKRINVTNLTADERRQLFANYMNQNGFVGFIQTQRPGTDSTEGKISQQTYYIFTYTTF